MAKKKTKNNNNDIFEELGIERLDAPRRQTAQELIQEARRPTARERAEIIKTAEAGIERERAEARRATLQKLKSYIAPPPRVSPGVRKLDTAIGSRVRKAVHLLAPRGGMIQRITTPAKKKVKGRRRGRPRKSYKLRYVPGIGAVRVPTHIYKKMMAEVKATRRLAEAQRQALVQQQYEAEQLAMTQDPRFQPSVEEAWADSEDMEHLADIDRIKQQQLRQQVEQQMLQRPEFQRPSIIRRAGEMFGKARITLMGGQQPQYPQDRGVPQHGVAPIQRPQVAPIHVPQLNVNRPMNPQVILMGGKSPMFGGRGNIMDQRNEFNETNKATVGF